MAVSEESISDKIETSSILEEIEKERANNGIAFNEKYSHKEDLENLLKLAEGLKDKCDNAQIKIRYIRFAQLFAGILIISYLAYKVAYFNLLDPIVLGVPVPWAMILAYIFLILFAENSIRNWKKVNLPDKIALSEVLQLLRETSNLIAMKEEWSVLARAEFRIRLSRFNLEEEKSKSAFSFFS